MSRKLQLKRGVKAALPSLAEGEPALVTDEKKLYIGTNNGNKAISMDGHTHAPAESGADPAGSAAAVDSKLTQHAANSSNPHGVTVGQIGAVPSGRTVNNKSLSGNITLYASDIGAAVQSASRSITLGTSGWSGSAAPFSQNVGVSGVTASNNIEVGITASASAEQEEHAASCKVKATTQYNGSITFTAQVKPTLALPVTIIILG
ncbi:MAG: hypothetical protein RR209_00695 [Angelakisella sp.]